MPSDADMLLPVNPRGALVALPSFALAAVMLFVFSWDASRDTRVIVLWVSALVAITASGLLAVWASRSRR